jgi:ABC-type antimicrobial peptide transport system permease subunit
MEDVVADSVAQRRFQMTLVLLLAAAAVFLAGLGIYGVVSQAVMQRTSEFGIRMALGADPRNIRRQVIRQGLVPVVVGLGGGFIASLGVGWLLRSLLFGLSPTDARSFAGASLFLLSVALLASFIPAWRASRIDPMIALRHE